jgi:Protein of unknown function (DUF3467)
MTSHIAKLPEDTDLVYANWLRLNASLLDLSIDFGYVEEPFMGPPEDGYPVRVVMSWEQAKGLIELLQDNVRVYEENVGRIRSFDGEEAGDDGDQAAPSPE